MVNNLILRKILVGQYRLRTTKDGRTKLRNGPIYELSVVQQHIKSHGLVVVNEDAEEDQEKSFSPELEDDELADLILTLEHHHYDDSERCGTTNGMLVDADGYTIYWKRRTRTESPHGEKTYVKFGFRENRDTCLVVSIHPSKH